jgi:hypothetical protein
MAKPFVATVSHELGRRAAKQRITASLYHIRAQLAVFASAVEEEWIEDRLDFRLTALGQTIFGHIDVFDDVVRIEVMLPGMLGFLGGVISSRIREQGLKLLGKR